MVLLASEYRSTVPCGDLHRVSSNHEVHLWRVSNSRDSGFLWLYAHRQGPCTSMAGGGKPTNQSNFERHLQSVPSWWVTRWKLKKVDHEVAAQKNIEKLATVLDVYDEAHLSKNRTSTCQVARFVSIADLSHFICSHVTWSSTCSSKLIMSCWRHGHTYACMLGGTTSPIVLHAWLTVVGNASPVFWFLGKRWYLECNDGLQAASICGFMIYLPTQNDANGMIGEYLSFLRNL